MSVDGQPCRWWKHAEVVARLKGVGEEGVSLQVATLLPSAEPPGTVSPALGAPNVPRPRPPSPRGAAPAADRCAFSRRRGTAGQPCGGF